MIEQLARIPVDVDYASEFRYRDPVLDENTLLLVISQSGETADTIAALREVKERAGKSFRFCNVQGSMITREADGTILTHAGPEIGVASTKAFTSQMIALYLFGLYLGQLRGTLSAEESRAHAQQLAELPVKMEHLLNDAEIEELSKEFFRSTDFLYLGRGINFPIGYTAENGRNNGGMINVITKSGTNMFKGSAWYNGRRDQFNENDYFRKVNNQAKPLYDV